MSSQSNQTKEKRSDIYQLVKKYIYKEGPNLDTETLAYLSQTRLYNKVFNPLIMLESLSKHPDICILFNKYLNNESLWSLTKLDDTSKALKWYKNILYSFHVIDRYGLQYRSKKDKRNGNDKIRTKILERLYKVYPLLSEYELNMMIDEFIKKYGLEDGLDLLARKCGISNTKKRRVMRKESNEQSDNMRLSIKQIIIDQIAKKDNICKEQCELYNNGQALFDSNLDLGSIYPSNDSSIIDILFIAEAPGRVEAETHVPFTGQSGQMILRPLINEIIDKNSLNWCMWNTVLCRPPNNRDPNPNEIKLCRRKLDAIVKLLKPKIIVAVGLVAGRSLTNDTTIGLKNCTNNTPIGYFNISDNESIPIYLTPHPAYILRNRQKSNLLKNALYNIMRTCVMLKNKEEEGNKEEDHTNKKHNMTYSKRITTSKQKYRIYELPKIDNISLLQNYYYSPIIYLFLTDQYLKQFLDNREWYLVDCQMLRSKNLCVAKFRHRSNHNRVEYIAFSDFFAYYNQNGPTITHKQQCSLVYAPINKLWNIRKNKDDIYFGDINPPVRYSHDILLAQEIYTQNVHGKNVILESDSTNRIYYIDIENEFDPNITTIDPIKAELPICLITRLFNNSYKTFARIPKALESKKQDILAKLKSEHSDVFNESDIVWCNNEKELLAKFIEDLHQVDPDIITGWNIFYDLAYIVNRMPQVGLDSDTISPLGEYRIDPRTNSVLVRGYITLDMLHLYQRMTFSSRQSYKLGYITSLELGKDEAKLTHEVSIKDTYFNNYAYYMRYNKRDVEVLDKLNKKLGHIELTSLLRLIAKSDWYSIIASQSPLVDAVLLTYLENDHYVAKNITIIEDEIVYPGAYVHNPKGGLFKAVIDLDFSSLYPSIIRTFNMGLETYHYKIPDQLAHRILYHPNELDDNETINLRGIRHNHIYDTQITIGELKQLIRDKYLLTINGCLFLRHKYQESLFSKCLADLLSQRKIYKKQWKQNKDPRDYRYQLAFKILANSIYGYLGFKNSRYFDLDLASAVTLTAQEAIKSTMVNADNILSKQIGNNEHIEYEQLSKFISDSSNVPNFRFVIYGDTDSLFLTLEELLKHHNIDSIFFDKINRSFKERLEVFTPLIDELEHQINDQINSFFISKHYLDPNHQYLNVKNEWIGETMLQLPVKKRYAVRLINPSGYSLEVKGLDIRRSDYPEFSKNVIQTVLDIIFEQGIDVQVLLAYINDTRKQFLELVKKRDNSLARPVTMSKSINRYKKLPSHVIGMKAWNEIEYPYFLEGGAKGYAFPILPNLNMDKAPRDKITKWNKFIKDNSIPSVMVVPDNGDILPEYYIIDTENLYEFCIVNRIDNLIGHLVRLFSNISGTNKKSKKRAEQLNLIPTW